MAELPNVGLEIYKALKMKGWSQAKLARDLNLSEKHVSQIITGKTRGDWSTVNYMLNHVGLKITITQENKDD